MYVCTQKYHTDDVTLPYLDGDSDWWRHYIILSKEFLRSFFSDVILQGNQWWRREMSAVLSS